MKVIDPAERLLKSLGVTEPKEIDLEAIAFDQGAEVRYCNLHGCEADIWPCMLICHTKQGRKWFTQAPMFHDRWFPQSELDAQTTAFDVVFGRSEGDGFPQIIGADAWFDRSEARQYEIFEQAKKWGMEKL
ncbi:hypothetical protein SLH49_18745 [Cognatiyoonia sp. IB215446]|uniref:hypothetical protein n=1 Tax=Cognatiyoonia sp. IB215446 TaxID=3097355 RepID=UPI002A17E34F|nr:hypothetical protein [Cognatiyoonia sp. IB215446]MDX8350033.1 hypothetical protein [Cognatiyoonia sp. IB215446]